MSNCQQCMVRKFNSLNELSKEELIRISSCKTIRIVKKGEIIFNEGDHINGVYCIKKGVCKVSKMSENGRNQIIHLVSKGNTLGERNLISEEACNLKAVALEDMEICYIPKEEIFIDLEKNPKFSMSVLKKMASNLKQADNLIVNMAQKTTRQRLAETLIYLDLNFTTPENKYINVHLSRDDFADIIGAATESTIRLLSDFKKKKIIKIDGKHIAVIDKTTLEKIAQGF
ncbi:MULTISPECIES: Crp/Fnr family transcriptional regulator [unclassified Polaribacter]|uniref:Crp/Fnr family transcriptional regulator n=1 Tax=unclassified Polaribacter TaxID=196858 RepID=UPI0011BD501E|nr:MULTISPECIES: Crp/Fnr family transcriptional regulator [unclassified Polaribacter]TXD51147.1 Crp/Fnr family transcriptional regulator [Polaribacter sp. IC063]TXD56760.1 Crp/Fnr family transcriptional regulator [Polaribacter sp. IC066]